MGRKAIDGMATVQAGKATNPWFAIGAFIGRHMAAAAPLCMLVGVLFPDQFSWMAPAVELMFAFMTFQSALATTSRDLLAVIRHSLSLLAALFVLFIVMPVLALAVGNLVVPGNTDAIAGMVIEFCVPMGVTGLMWVDIYNGNRSFGLAVVVISTVLAPLTMPLTIQLLMGATVHVDLVAMMLDLLIMIALPAVAGMACNDLSHGKANARVAPWLAPASKIMLVLILATNSTRISGSMHHFTPELLVVALAMALLSGVAYVFGYILARLMHRNVGECITLGVASGSRNITTGAVLAAAYFPSVTMFPVMMGTLFQHVLAGVFGWAVRKLDAHSTPAAVPEIERVYQEHNGR